MRNLLVSPSDTSIKTSFRIFCSPFLLTISLGK